MVAGFRFPLYVFRRTADSAIVFQEGGRLLPLFTSAEKASTYRYAESLDAQMVRLRTASDLRNLFSTQGIPTEIKIVVDPIEGFSGFIE